MRPRDRNPLERLRRRNRTRRWLERVLAAGDLSDPMVNGVRWRVVDTAGWRWRERAAMCWFLRHAVEGQRERAAESLCRVAAAPEFWRPGRLLRGGLRLAAALLTFVVLFTWTEIRGSLHLGLQSEERVWAFAFSAPAAAIVLFFSQMIEERRTRWCRRQAIESLGVLAVPASVSTVAKAAASRSAGIRDAGTHAILPILDAVTEQHRDALEDAIPDICELLRHRSPAVRLAALEALGRFAGGRAVEPVNDLTFEQNPPEIEEALARVLPILRERKRQEREAASLLRPVHAPSGGADVLLRPAPSAPGEDPAQLLRAVEDGATPPE